MCNRGCCCNIYFHFPVAAACLNIVESTRTMHSKCVCRALLRFISSQCPIKNLHWMQLQYIFHSVHSSACCDHWTQPFNKYASSSALYPLLFIVLVFWCIPLFLSHFQHKIQWLCINRLAVKILPFTINLSCKRVIGSGFVPLYSWIWYFSSVPICKYLRETVSKISIFPNCSIILFRHFNSYFQLVHSQNPGSYHKNTKCQIKKDVNN